MLQQPPSRKMRERNRVMVDRVVEQPGRTVTFTNDTVLFCCVFTIKDLFNGLHRPMRPLKGALSAQNPSSYGFLP